jgi:predicted cation transporter
MPFVIRWLIALVLVSATWNPTEWNFIRWVAENGGANLPVSVLSGLVLLIGYIIYLRATLRSIGPVGMGLVVAVFGALIWVLVDQGVLSTENTALNQWLAIVACSLVLGIGLSWSIVRRRISGQADVDDVDEP